VGGGGNFHPERNRGGVEKKGKGMTLWGETRQQTGLQVGNWEEQTDPTSTTVLGATLRRLEGALSGGKRWAGAASQGGKDKPSVKKRAIQKKRKRRGERTVFCRKKVGAVTKIREKQLSPKEISEVGKKSGWFGRVAKTSQCNRAQKTVGFGSQKNSPPSNQPKKVDKGASV